MANPITTEIARIFKAFGYSMSGFRIALKDEASFRTDCIIAVVLFPVALWLGESGLERALLISSLIFLMFSEMVNTAVERAVDRVSTDYHPMTGAAKDLGSACVFLALLNGAVVWGLILFDKFFA